MNASQSPASKTRLIKKYPNRRLYDTTLSRYITLEDVCDLITNRVDVRVIEQRGERDITRDILLQVFAVQEQGDAPRLTQQFLTDLIRSYGAQTSDDLSLLLERSLDRILAIDGGQAIADHN